MDQASHLDWTYLCFCLALILVLLFYMRRRSFLARKVPPGPKGLPIIGYLLYPERVYNYRRCIELAKQYGPVISFQLGFKTVIFLNTFKSIKEVLTKKEMLFRSENSVGGQPKVKGLTFLNGEDWNVNRRFCLRILHGLDVGKKLIEENIQDELKGLRKQMARLNGVPVDVDRLLKRSVFNNTATLVFGKPINSEDRRHQVWFEKMEELSKLNPPGTRFFCLPRWALKIAELLPFTTSRKVKETYEQMKLFINEEIQRHHKEGLVSGRHEDLIGHYTEKIEEHEANPESKFTNTNLLGNVFDLFNAGTNTVKRTVYWHLLNCADKSHTIQRRIHGEIDRVIGRDRFPQLEDLRQMPFTMATMWEMYRWRSPGPFGLPREANMDISYNGYIIPKGSTVMPNIAAVHTDPTLWTRPEEFLPDRFIEEDGYRLKPIPEVLIPFSLGRRMCPAQSFANTQVFLYVTCLLQKFLVVPPEGKRINLECLSREGYLPRTQELRFIRR